MSDDALQDHSDKEGMRIYVELKREAVPQVALNKLFKLTPLQTTFGYNAVALVDGVPKTLSLLELVRHYLDYQREVVVRRSKYELRQAEKRAHVLQGYLIALDNLDEVIALIRGAADADAGQRRGHAQPVWLRSAGRLYRACPAGVCGDGPAPRAGRLGDPVQPGQH